jgi:Protein of unknown function (DUF2628)
MFVPVPPGRDQDRPTSTDGTVAIDPRTEQELRAFVGSNANFYLRAWAPVLTGQGRITRVNVAAFFLASFWLGYRKMYARFLLLAGILIVEGLMEFVVFAAILEVREVPWAPGMVVGFIAGIVCGLCANRWYLSDARRAIAKVRAMGLDEAAHLRELARRGGTTILAPFLLLLTFCVGWSVIVELLLAFILRGIHG